MNKLSVASVAALLTLATTGLAQAQNWQAVPTYGTQNLTHNFQPDPVSVSLQAGGPDSVSHHGCNGFIQASAPDVDLNYVAGGGLPLNIYAESSADTTLLIYTPSGQWICNDDGGEGRNPLVRFDNPESGNYNIWVGNYENQSTPQATLRISEVAPVWSGAAGASAGGSEPRWEASPTYGTQNLSHNFQPDPVAIALQAGGSDPVSRSGCNGYIQASAPDVDLNYEAGGGLPLNFYVKASADTTLLIYTPDQRWICDDDGGEGRNPLLSLQNPQSGNYNIWVGNYDGTDTPNATLYISEIAPQW